LVILLKIYATLVALTLVTGLGHLVWGMIDDDLHVAERGLGIFASGLAGILAGGLATALTLLWAA
jgi:hypothetical protein